MRVLMIALCLIWTGFGVWAQEQGELNDGFGDLKLGIELEDAKAALGVDPNFAYRGDPDVSLVPSTGTPIIETSGRTFIEKAILQFADNRLYILTLILDRSRLDYFGVYTEFESRYGEPDRLDPGQAVWESESVRLLLERPLTIKYIDVEAFTAIVDAGELEESLDNITRERFLEQL